MAVEVAMPTLGTILVTAVIDSINPCAIGVLILLISTLLATKRTGQMIKIGLLYIGACYVTYFLYGLGLITFLAVIPQVIAEYISIAVGLIVVLAGLLEIKDFFWYGQGISLAIPKEYAKKIEEKMHKISIGTALFLGVFVASVELPCTGGPYLAITLILSQNFNLGAFIMLIIYNFIFVLPLLVILFLVVFGINVKKISNWKQSNKSYMRLFTGFLLLGLGWLLMLIANGAINLN